MQEGTYLPFIDFYTKHITPESLEKITTTSYPYNILG